MRLLLAASVILVVACRQESIVSNSGSAPVNLPEASLTYGTSCYSAGDHEQEEEVWGCLWGVTPGVNEWSAELTPSSDHSCIGSMLVGFDGYVNGTLGNDGAHWGWYDHGSEFPDHERHGGAGAEVHCVESGVLTWALLRNDTVIVTLPIDYTGFSGFGGHMVDQTTGYQDVVIQYDGAADTVAPTASMAVSVGATRSAWWIPHTPVSNTIYVPSNYPWLRVAADGSQSNWSRSGGWGLLMQVSWGGSVTNWTNTQMGQPLARARQFTNGESMTVTLTVRKPTGLTASTSITAIGTGPLDAQITPRAYVYVDTPTVFRAAQSSVITGYRWCSTTGATCTPTGAFSLSDSVHTFTIASAGTAKIKVEVTNQSGVTDIDSTTVPSYAPLSAATIYGAYAGNPGPILSNQALCDFVAQPTGGVGPYSVIWRKNTTTGKPLATTSFLTLATGTTNFTLYLWITDATSTTVSTSRTITVSGTGGVCF